MSGATDDGAPADPARVAWIDTTPVDAEDRAALDELRRRERDPSTGRLDHILAVHGLAPATGDDHARLYHTILHAQGRTALADRELVGLVVSVLNGCRY